MQALGRRPDARARHKGGQNPFADDPASCHLLRSSVPLPYGAHWPLPAKASSQRKGSQRAPRQNLTLGALWNASGASAMWVKGSRPRRWWPRSPSRSRRCRRCRRAAAWAGWTFKRSPPDFPKDTPARGIRGRVFFSMALPPGPSGTAGVGGAPVTARWDPRYL